MFAPLSRLFRALASAHLARLERADARRVRAPSRVAFVDRLSSSSVHGGTATRGERDDARAATTRDVDDDDDDDGARAERADERRRGSGGGDRSVSSRAGRVRGETEASASDAIEGRRRDATRRDGRLTTRAVLVNG